MAAQREFSCAKIQELCTELSLTVEVGEMAACHPTQPNAMRAGKVGYGA
jgi:hypothetical protein